MSGSGDKMCSKCWLPDCKLCDDDSTMSCKMCEKGYSLQDQGGMKMCVKRCEAGTFREKMTMDKATVPDFIKNLDYAVCTNCSADCSKCKDKADFCLQCSADDKFAQPDGTCANTCPDGTYPRDGRCKKCGPNIATCGINATTEEFEVKTCDAGFFVGILGKKCVPEFRCGKGFYGDTGTNKCTECDKLKCIECKGGADKCTKCIEIGEFASKDGSCKTDPDTVECEDGFYLKAGICKKCDSKCNGCTGEGNNNCLACADNMLAAIKSVPTTSGDPTVYTCVDKCPILHEVVDDNGVSMCSSCPDHATKKVFDLTTHTCVVKDTGCPSNAIQANATLAFPKLANGTNADAQICIPCSDRCATCSPKNPHMCLT